MTTNDFVQYADEILKNFNLKTTDFNLVKEGILSADPIIWYRESVEFIGKCTTQEKAALLAAKAQKAFDKRHKGTIPEYEFVIYPEGCELRFIHVLILIFIKAVSQLPMNLQE